MSLINDALKRAKEAQDQAPPPLTPGPQLRPADAQTQTRAGLGILIPIACCLVASGLLVAAWWMMKPGERAPAHKPGKSSELTVQARTPKAPVKPVAAPAPVAAAAQPSKTEPAQTASPAKPQSPAQATATTASLAPPAPAPAAQAVVAQAPPQAAPLPLKLQGIYRHPTRPSAMISRKVMFIGDSIEGYELKAINGQSVSLKGSGGTIVLTLK
jgi:hypothetical protein